MPRPSWSSVCGWRCVAGLQPDQEWSAAAAAAMAAAAAAVGPGAVGGLGSREELLAAYVAAGGFEISAAELTWWEVLASLRWGVITMFMGGEHRSGMES